MFPFSRVKTFSHLTVTSLYQGPHSSGKLSSKPGCCPSHQTLRDKVHNFQNVLSHRRGRKCFIVVGYSLKKKNTCRKSQHHRSLRMSSGETGSGKNKTVAIVRDNSRSIIRWVLFYLRRHSSTSPSVCLYTFPMAFYRSPWFLKVL